MLKGARISDKNFSTLAIKALAYKLKSKKWNQKKIYAMNVINIDTWASSWSKTLTANKSL